MRDINGTKSGIMLVAEPVGDTGPAAALPPALSGPNDQSLNRPISFSRITNSRIIIRSPFPLRVEARAMTWAFPF